MKTIFISIVGSTMLLSACSNEPKSIVAADSQQEPAIAESVIKPIEGLEIQPRIFSVSGTDASIIELPNGGSIAFPQDAFADENGNPIQGKVDIHWKEYHSLTDIMLSGIPMKYDSAGVANDFVSGGMFTIDAFQNGKDVELAKGKSATVNLASYSDTPCFNFYDLDEKSGKWNYETTKTATALKEDSKDVEAKSAKQELLDVHVDVSEFPELENKQIVAWKLKNNLDAKSRNTLRNSQTAIKLTKNGNDYTMTFKDKKETIVANVEPFLLEQAMADKARVFKKHDEDFADLVAFQDFAQSGKLIRSIDIPGMGTYNWDKVLKRAQETVLLAKFNLNKKVNYQYVSLFFISPKENVSIQCDALSNSKFKFDPTLPNYLVAILPDNSICVADKNEFNKVPKDAKNYTFQFKELNKKVESPEELGKVLQEFMKKNS